MEVYQQSLQSRNQNTTSRRKRCLLDAFVDAGQRLNAIENQLTTMTETFRNNIDIENHFNHELYETEQHLIDKDNKIAQEIYSKGM